jgi:hypothetical protein
MSRAWILSALFALVGAWHFVLAARACADPGRRTRSDLATPLLHAVMSAAMLAMLWPWQSALPAGLEAGFFAAAAGWFLVVERGARQRWYDAASMAAMVWMLVAPGMPGMPGMPQMPGTHEMAMPAPPSWSTEVTLMLACVAGACALWQLTRCLDPRADGPRGPALLRVLMAGGLALSLAPMA